jgi:hypothetical protein
MIWVAEVAYLLVICPDHETALVQVIAKLARV